jgi:hypothetical protein
MDPETYKIQAANKMITIVDEHNNVIGSRRRAEMRTVRLIHRATITSSQFKTNEETNIHNDSKQHWTKEESVE